MDCTGLTGRCFLLIGILNESRFCHCASWIIIIIAFASVFVKIYLIFMIFIRANLILNWLSWICAPKLHYLLDNKTCVRFINKINKIVDEWSLHKSEKETVLFNRDVVETGL